MVFRIFRKGGRTQFVFATPIASAGRGLPGGANDAVYDGDTLRVLLRGTQSLRFLGCDTAELAYQVPVGPAEFDARQKIEGPLWTAYLDDPFASDAWPAFADPLHPLVEERLRGATGVGTAANHAFHAEEGRKALVDIMLADQAAIGLAVDAFELFTVFAHEVLDGYGRPLVFVNTSADDKSLRPELTYNERMIANGAAAPYFIWPNVDPFRGRPSVENAALPPAELRAQAAVGKLGRSRRDAADARAAGLGIYASEDPLRLMPFELRMLGDRRGPSRWVIDLGAEPDDPTLLPPEGYPLIGNPEDRLFVPAEYVALFVTRGWRAARLVRW